MRRNKKFVVQPFDGDRMVARTIANLHLQIRIWQRVEGQNQFRYILDSQEDLCEMSSYYLKPGGNFFIARNSIDNQIAGFIGLVNYGGGQGRLRRMGVLPSYQRCGIGTLLMESAINWARQNNFEQIALTTGIKEKAKSLYEKFGFQEVGFDDECSGHLMKLVLRKIA